MLGYKFTLKGKRGVGDLASASMVLGVAATLVVMVSSGASLIQKSKLGSVITDVKAFTKAVSAFEEKYKALPGDTANVSTLTGATAGNGNSSIDTAAEAMQFWKHLSAAGLIKGNYDGSISSTYIPGTGVPVGPFKGSGYNVLDPTSAGLPSEAIALELSGFTSSSNSQAILTPEDAKAIDKKMDDGNPNTGVVRGINAAGDNSANTQCATGAASTDTYSVNSKSVGCRLRFIIRKSAQASDSITITGTQCNQVGLTRRSDDPNDKCPVGTIGKIMKTCRLDSNNAGSWVVAGNNCAPVTCIGGQKYNEKRVLPCMSGQTGTGTVQTCSAEGVWVTNSVSCAPDTTVACTPAVNGDIRPPQACNWSQTGMVRQTCASNTWSTVTSNTCAAITCTSPGGNVGDVDATNFDCATYTGYTTPSYYTGSYKKTCTMDGTWKVTSNTCAPALYTAACTVGVTADFNIGCPPGEMGSLIQTCVGTGNPGKWITKSDTCEPIKCSGERVGSSRVIKDLPCPGGRAGVMIEVCESDGGTPPKGKWTANTTHCATTMCDATKDRAGNAIWPYQAASTTANGTCMTGYTSAGPTRACDANGNWGSVTNPCTRVQCTNTPEDNATWPTTNSLTSNVSGTCIWPDYEGSPEKDCGANGTWSASRGACVASALPIRGSNLKLWLDAADYSTVYSDSGCTTSATSGGGVGCWKDKSGNGSHANVGSAPTYRTGLINNKPSLQFGGSSYLQSNVSMSNNLTAFVVVKKIGDSNSTSVLLTAFTMDDWYVPNAILFLETSNGPSPLYTFVAQIAGSVSAPAYGTPYIASTVLNGTSNTMYVNGATGSSGTYPALVSTTKALIGARWYYGGVQDRYNGYISEVILYNTTLSTSDRQSVESYLSSKWGITLSAPPISPTPLLWLDGADASTVLSASNCTAGTPADNGNVGCWVNKGSSASTNFVQATGGNQPKYSVGGAGANSYVTFNGSSSYMTVSDATKLGFDGVVPYTFLAAFKLPVSGGGTIYSKYNAGVAGHMYFSTGSNYYIERESGAPWSISSTVTTDANPHVLTGKFDGTNLNMYVDGNFQSSAAFGAIGNGTTITPVLGATQSGSSPAGFLNADLYEFIAYNSSLSDTDRQGVENYLIKKWGVGANKMAGSVLWLDASDSSTVFTSSGCTGAAPANNGSVGCWKDKSGNSRNATTGTSPTYVSGVINNIPVIRFNGTNQYLTVGTSLLNSITGGNVTTFVVAKTTVIQNSSIFDNNPDASSPRFNIHLPWDNGGVVYWDFGDIGASGRQSVAWGGSAGTPYVWTFNASGGASQNIWRNGTNIATKASSSIPTFGTSYSFDIGAAGRFVYYNGDIGEVIIYNSALATSARQDIESYLGSKWGITIAGPPPTSPVSGMKLWMDANDSNTIFTANNCTGAISNGNTVGCWQDKSGNAWHATQSNASQKPTYVTSVINSKPVLRFTAGSATTVRTGALAWNQLFSGTQTTLMFTVRNASGTIFYWDGAPNIRVNLAAPAMYDFPNGSSGRLVTNIDISASNSIVTAITNGSNSTMWINGTQVGSISGVPALSTGSAVAEIGTYINGICCSMTGDIAELLIYNTALSTTDRQANERYLGNKWGITVP